MFLGREKELATLESFHKSKKFEMLIVYGRRRIGKTRLLTEFIKDKNAIFYVAEENNDLMNLNKFTKVVLGFFKENLNISFDQWSDLFMYISKKTTNERLVIVLDELPYIAQSNQSFLSMLQNAIDHALIKQNIMLILCGSSISFMEDEIVAHKSPLYGRKTGQLKLHPLTYLESHNIFETYSLEDRFKAYAILGGIPHYLIQFNPKLNLEDNIINHCFSNTSLFYDEPKNLLHQELRSPVLYNSILEAIAGGATKLNEISTKIRESSSKTSKYLQSLLELEIVQKNIPIGQKETRKTHYSLSDPLFDFLFRYVYKYRSLIEQGLGAQVYNNRVENEINAFYGKRFEEICLQYLVNENKNMRLEFLVDNFGRWWGNNPTKKRQEEIDIMGISNDSSIYCECKFKNEKIGLDIYEKLVERSLLIPKQNKYYYLFSKSGFSKPLLDLAKSNRQVRLITLEDLYS